ncbi:zinc finger protein 142 isoform X1 [Alligator mississippiensis]|uniref:zinc finger protein 142 isoform X1 n=2 Tax=Alligator mississippiensis TaxID=8496 RepID=UPI0028772A04|nr:zinc finger protein 142 isoform X1 [Alligator mississippiensis]XP_019347985.2 zinc finger protein 142 isoform X1 [Alligator mississippiensis]
MSAETVAADMDALCPELLLPAPADTGRSRGPDAGVAGPSALAVRQSLLLAEGAPTGVQDVEIFVEAMAGNVALSNPGSATEVLVKVVELYFCERCGQSFSDPGQLTQHQCLTLAAPESLELPSVPQLAASTTKGPGAGPGLCQEPPQRLPETGRQGRDLNCAGEHLLCPICQADFALPGELKEHFKTHRNSTVTPACPAPGCPFLPGDRRQLRGHVRRVHQAIPISCVYRACPLLFLSRPAMEEHHRSHFPFHCAHCPFVSANIKLFRQHAKSHCPEPAGATEIFLDMAGVRETLPESAEAGEPHSRGTRDFATGTGEVPPDDKASGEVACSLDPPAWDGSHSAPEDTSHEDGQASAGEDDSESSGDESLDEEEGESTGEAATRKAKAPRAQRFKGDVAEGSESLFKTHMCPECKRCFKKRTHLVEHLHLHFPDPSLQCPNCGKFFTSKSKLKIHLLRETGEKAHRCPLCQYRSVERNALNRHMASMHEGISNFYSDVYACPVCQEPFKLSQALKEHLKSHQTESKRLSCFEGSCNYGTEDRKDFMRHLKEAHGLKAVECTYHACSLLFGTAEAMETHRKTHYAFHCQQCDFICSNKHVFRKHKRQGHPGSERLQCGFCPYTTFNPVEFHDHLGKMHAHEKIHKCGECGFATAHKRVLMRHALLHTGEKPHKCEQCDFTCRDVSYLSKHMLTHSSAKDFMCTECGYVTKWKHYLNVHMRKHTGDLRYQCNQCSYRCHRADQLSSHKLRHQGKSLMCEVCGFACKRKYELQKHAQAKHAQGYQAPVFQCRYCSYQSKYKQALRSHENCKHTQQREFRCALCAYCTFSNTSLFFHKRKAHGYVPGDKDWLQHYASKEQEAGAPHEATGCHAGEEPWQGASSEAPEEEEDGEPAGAEPLPELAAGQQEGGTNVATEEGETSSEAMDGCTLHLETLEVSAQVVLEGTAPAEALGCKDPGPGYGILSATEALALEDSTPGLEDIADFEEEPDVAGAPEGNVGSPGVEGRPSQDLLEGPGDPSAGQDPASPTAAGMGESGQTMTAGTEEGGGKPGDEPTAEWELRALRQQDKEQAETLVLEGRVQMLVVQTERQVFTCRACPYVTRKERALALHAKAGCQARRAPLLCHGCGASFKQQRGLNTHLLKKCPVLLKKGRTPKLVGLEQPRNPPQDPQSAVMEDSTGVLEAAEGSPEPGATEDGTEGAGGSQVPEPPLEAEPVPVDPGSPLPEAVLPGASPAAVLPAPPAMSETAPEGAGAPTSPSEKYRVEQGKLRCNTCAFSCSRLSTITSHVADGCRGPARLRCALCPQAFRSRRALESHRAQQHGQPQEAEGPGNAGLRPRRRLSCPSCPFTCQQERALRTHAQRGCGTRRGTAPQPPSSAAPPLRRHRRPPRGRYSQRPALQCRQCEFTCKQARCLGQHVRVKHEGLKPHQCPYCEFSTTRRYRLEAHQSLHTGVGRIACGSCSQTFGTNSKLRLHRLRVHEKTPTHFCPLCDYSGYLQNDITRHINSCHRGEPLYPCARCDARFSSPTALKQHALRRHAEPAACRCPHCGLQCRSRATLRGHARRQHPPRLECGACHEAFATRRDLETHRQQQHFSHRCGLCGFAARERQQLVRHYVDSHEPPAAAPAADRPLACPSCDFTCRHQLVLEHHVKGHGGTRVYKCSDCAYTTKNKQKITWHIRIHTGEKPYKCHLCTYTCADPSRLKYHMRIHKEERKYLCPECGYKCKWVNQLKYHMTKHTGLKPYGCEECEYRTNRADALRVHRDTRHREARAHMCEQCGKAFKTRFLLRTHLRAHSEARPYVCGVCRRAFRWAAGLRHHFLTHTDLRPFFCRFCAYRAKQKFQVVKHVRRHHPDRTSATDPTQGVGKDPGAPTLHLHDVQLHGRPRDDGGGAPAEPQG